MKLTKKEMEWKKSQKKQGLNQKRYIFPAVLIAVLLFGYSPIKDELGFLTDTVSSNNTEASVNQELETNLVDADTSATPIVVFRSEKLRQEHFEKHGVEMGFDSAIAYEAAADAVVQNPKALHKTEKEDGDDVYYLEETNEFVIVSTDGYLRTYFNPSDGMEYYERQ